MNLKKMLVVFAIVGLSTIIMAAKYGGPPCYDLTGSWILSNPPDSPNGAGPVAIVTWHSIGNNGERWSADVDGVIGNPAVWHPEAMSYTSSGGTAVKTGEKQFKGTSLGYLLNSEKQIVLVTVVNLDGTLLSCDQYFADATFSLYAPTQDKNNDGIPDSDEAPVLCMPWQFYGNRVPLMEKCIPVQP